MIDVVDQHEQAKAKLKAASDEYEAAQAELDEATSAKSPNIVRIRKAEFRREEAQRKFDQALAEKEALDDKIGDLKQISKRNCKRSFVEYLGDNPYHQVRITNARQEHHTYRFDQVYRDSKGFERRVVFCNEPLDLLEFDRLKANRGGRVIDLYRIHVSKSDQAKLDEWRRRRQELEELRRAKDWKVIE